MIDENSRTVGTCGKGPAKSKAVPAPGSCGRWLFEVLYAVLESLHLGIERTYRSTMTSLPHFDWRCPGVKCGEQFCFDTLKLHVDPLLVVVSQSHRFDYSAV